MLDVDPGDLPSGGRVNDPVLSEVRVGKSGEISVHAGFANVVVKELRRSGRALNFTLVLRDAAGRSAACLFSRTADSAQSPTRWTDPVPEVRLAGTGGCSNGSDGTSPQTADTSPPR